jgi:rare lipoprotein A
MSAGWLTDKDAARRHSVGMTAATTRAMLLSLVALASLAGAAGDAAAETGVASFYAKRFAGRTMADGTRMDPHGDNAASRTLPLGTRARVTNLQTGQSAFVTIRDRGPYVKGRIVDLSPATARLVGITSKAGLAKVEVTPITQFAAIETRAAAWN